MISQLIIEKIDVLRAGGQIAPLLITEMQACEVYGSIF
jgi:hypothetical protein